MPAPTNSNAMSLGRPLIDMTAFGPDVPESVRQAFQNLQETLIALGWVCAAKGADTQYKLVVTREVTGSDVLYATSPTDPMNPEVLSIGAGAATVVWQDEGVTIVTAGTFNAVGTGVAL